MKVKKLVCGVGVNDADYAVTKRETTVINGKRKRKIVWVCPFYQVWKNMIERCYSVKYQERYPTYIGCTVTEEWLTFSVFKNWMMTQDWQGNQLDKDILFEGNKVYNPEACVFVSGVVNSFTIDSGVARGEWSIGVSWDKHAGKYKSQCSNPFTNKYDHLGYFECEKEAHQAWLKRKLELAKELSVIQTDTRVAEALVERYTKYKTNN